MTDMSEWTAADLSVAAATGDPLPIAAVQRSIGKRKDDRSLALFDFCMAVAEDRVTKEELKALRKAYL